MHEPAPPGGGVARIGGLQVCDRLVTAGELSDYEWKKLPRIFHKTFDRGVRRDIRAQLRELKKVLEEG